ncbi:ATP-binding protein [Chitinibacter sp. SCUT-21]|uniref:ATP-binding protein n=1 Tax=Chitinibacter sp. SCUT-21 TaxID=2970891 RepID=UPI0035A69E6E
MQTVVTESIPTILESTQLEQEANRLQIQAQQLVEADDLVSIAKQQNLIEQSLRRMAKAAQLLIARQPDGAPQLNEQIQISRAAAEALAHIAQQHQADLSHLRMLKMRIEWLHDDLENELRLLTEEYHLRLNPPGSARLASALHYLQILEQLRNGEHDLARAMLALSVPSQKTKSQAIFKQIQDDAQKLLVLAEQLPVAQSGSLHELFGSLAKIAAVDGELSQKLTQFNRSTEQMREQLAELEQQLIRQNQQAAKLSRLARDNAQQQLQQSLQTSERGRWSVALASTAAMGLMLWILFGLIGQRVIRRLALLGQNMAAIAQGNYHLPQTPEGHDEIAQLGRQVQHLAQHMTELERTNALALIEHTDAALLICDLAGRIISINQAARRFCPTLQVGDELNELWPAESRPDLSQLDQDKAIDITLPFGPIADENYVRLLARTFQQKDTECLMVTLFDVSAQMRSAVWLGKMVAEKTAALDESNAALRAEIDDRKRAQDSLIQATKFAVLGQTTTSLAHELNQPLAAMTNYMYLAKKSAEDVHATDLVSTLAQSEKVLDRMARLIRSYRTLGRTAPASPALYPIDIMHVINDIVELLQSRIRKQHITLILPSIQNAWVMGEVIRLEQICLNLVSNALDALSDCPSPQLELALIRLDQDIELMIMDNGAGLSPETVGDIFQAFYTTKPDGLGLGLSICQSLASECHAHIRMASQLDGGAIFILSMEASATDAA